MNKHIYLSLIGGLFFLIMPAMRAHAQYPLYGYCGRETVYNNDSTNLFWQVDTTSRVLTITGVGRMFDYDTDTKAPWYPWRNYIERIVLPNGLTEIGTYAMYDLDRMDSIRWGGSLTTIRNHAFENCDILSHLFLPESLVTIKEYAFSYCNRLKRLQMGGKVEVIESMAFVPTDSIETIDFGNSPTNIGYSAFAYPWWNSYKNNLISIRAKKIKSIGSYAFFYCPNLVSLQLGDSIERIEGECFYHCSSLPSVHFPASLNYIEGSSFSYSYVLDTITVDPLNSAYNSDGNCNAVMRTSDNVLILGCKSTIIPSATTRIESYAFRGCIGLQTLNLPFNIGSIGVVAFQDCSGLQTVSFSDNLTNIEERAFENCNSLTSLVLPEGLLHIGDHAFSLCTNLQSINVPNSVNSIDCHAFYECRKLTQPVYNNTLFARMPHNYSGTYTIPSHIQKVCCGAFHECDSITIVHIPNSVKEIGQETFLGCDNLQSITLSDSITNIPYRLFGDCYSLQSVVIPDAVTQIGSNAFDNCRSLSSLSFPANLTSIEYAIVDGCNKLTNITWNCKDARLAWIFYDNYYKDNIHNYMWSYHPFYSIHQQITSFTFGDSVQVIPRYLCYGMENLTSLAFGYKVDSIEQDVFEGCQRVKSIHWNARNFKTPRLYVNAPFYPIRDSITSFAFGDSVRHIPAYLCHSMSGLHEVHIPKNVSSIGDFAFRYLGVLDSISVDPANTHYDSRGNCNALMETSSNLLMLGCYKTQIPANTQGIDACAFRNVRNLPTVTLPPSVTFIGKEAFNGCINLKNLTLSKNIGTINDYAFQDCDSLYNITLPDSLWYIGMRAFANCTHLQSVVLPEKVELIDQYAFSGCSSMRSITCNAPEPPSILETTFRGTSCPIYVQCPSIMAYRSAPVWKDYGTRVSGLFFNTLSVRPNDYSFGRVYIRQQPDCEHNAILEADPILGYEFVSWQDTLGNVLSKDLVYEFTLDEDKSIIAEFIRKPNALEDMESSSRIWVQGHEIKVLSELNTQAKLYDLMGHEIDRCIVEAGVESSIQVPTSGVYVVITDNNQQKVIVQ